MLDNCVGDIIAVRCFDQGLGGACKGDLFFNQIFYEIDIIELFDLFGRLFLFCFCRRRVWPLVDLFGPGLTEVLIRFCRSNRSFGCMEDWGLVQLVADMLRRSDVAHGTLDSVVVFEGENEADFKRQNRLYNVPGAERDLINRFQVVGRFHRQG